MPLELKTDPPPLRIDEHGVVRVGHTRVLLELVVNAADAGVSAEEIVERYPSLNLADVHATLAYILRHRPEIDAYLTESEEQAEEMRRLIEERSPQAGLREELKRRLVEQVGQSSLTEALKPRREDRPWMRWAGVFDTGDPDSSSTIDDVVYGREQP